MAKRPTAPDTSKTSNRRLHDVEPEDRKAEKTPKPQPAEVIPFPIHRQREVVDKMFGDALLNSSDTPGAYRHLRTLVERHRKKLEKLGVAPHRIERDVYALEQMLFRHGDSEEKRRA